MTSLRKLLDDPTEGAGRLFALVIQFLILISLLTFSIETLPDLDATSRSILESVEIFTVVVFTIEYLLRVLAAERKLAFIFSFFGLIDLIAILPFFLTRTVDLRGLRVLRLLRIVRVFKILRYTRAVDRFSRAFNDIKTELIVYGIISIFLIYLAAIGIYYFESEVQPDSFGDVFSCLWWAVATLTTVGYGDVYPITTAGRMFTGMLLLVGLSVIAIPSGLLASALTAIRAEDAEAAAKLARDQENSESA